MELPVVLKKRSRSGCLVCRARKVRCGQERPSCAMCERLQFDCKYAEPSARRKKAPDAAGPTVPVRKSSVSSSSTTTPPGHPPPPVSPPTTLPSVPVPPPAAAAAVAAGGPLLIPKEDPEQFWDWLSGQAPSVPSSQFAALPGLQHREENAGLGMSGMEAPFAWLGAAGDGVGQYGFCLDAGLQPALESPIGYQPLLPVATDQEIINHFILNTSAITKIRDSAAPNLYLGLFCEAMNNPLLYTTLLAFSSVHHSQWAGEEALQSKAKARQQEAHAVLVDALAAGEADIDKLLPAILMGVSAAMHADCTAVAPVAGLLSSALKLLQGAPPFQDLPIITQRSAYVIAAVDVRLQLFGLGSGDYTRHLVALSDASSPASQEPSNMGLSSVLHVNLFLSRVAGLDLMIQRSSSEADLRVIRETAMALVEDMNRSLPVYDPPSLDPYASLSMYAFIDLTDIDNDLFNKLFMAGLFHGACIYLFRILEPIASLASLPSLSKTPGESALRILYMAMYVSKIRDMSQAVWPRPFFFASLELADPVHFDFMLRQLRLGDKWASAIEKTIQLLLEVKTREVRGGRRVNIRHVMDASTGPFIM